MQARIISLLEWLNRAYGTVIFSGVLGGILSGFIIDAINHSLSQAWVDLNKFSLLQNRLLFGIVVTAAIALYLLGLWGHNEYIRDYAKLRIQRVRRIQIIDPTLHLNLGNYPTKQFYEWHHYLTTARKALQRAITKKFGGFIVMGPPMVGKTRLIIEAVKHEAPGYLMVICTQGSIDSEQMRRLYGRRCIFFIDNLYAFNNPADFVTLVDALQDLRKKAVRLIVLATCRSGKDEAIIFRFNDRLGELGMQLDVEPMARDSSNWVQFLQFAADEHAHDPRIVLEPENFDGTPGSALLGLGRRSEQVRRYENEQPDAVTVLKAMRLLLAAEIYLYPQRLVKLAATAVFGLEAARCEAATDFLVREKWMLPLHAEGGEKDVMTLLNIAYIEQCLKGIYPVNPIQKHLARLAEAMMAQPVEVNALFNLSAALWNDPTSKSAQYDLALRCAQTALAQLGPVRDHRRWLQGYIWLGLAYERRRDEKRDVRAARDALETALQAWQPTDPPNDRAVAMHDLGIIYKALMDDAWLDHLERAKQLFEEAIAIWSQPVDREKQAAVLNDLALTYAELPTGDRHAHLQEAIRLFHEVLQVWTPTFDARLNAQAKSNLADAYRDLDDAQWRDHLAQAISLYREALAALPLERTSSSGAFPYDHAIVQRNLGQAYLKRDVSNRHENQEQAIACFQIALSVLTREDYPEDYATTQNELGRAYLALLEGDQTEHLHQAQQCFDEALTLRPRATMPIAWAETTFNLGLLHQARAQIAQAQGDPTTQQDEAEQAKTLWQTTLSIFTATTFPRRYVEIQGLISGITHSA
jgi:tetratricopeptide (TPR) repeat protein